MTASPEVCAICVDDAALAVGHGWSISIPSGRAPILGWVTLHPVAHRSSPEQLSSAEAEALGSYLRATATYLVARTGAERIYVANWAEACRHVHFHLISRLPELADQFQGARIFDLMGGAQDRPAIAAQFELLTALRQHLTKEGIA